MKCVEPECRPEPCSCGAQPALRFLAHEDQWQVHCPACDKAGAASADFDQAVERWNGHALAAH